MASRNGPQLISSGVAQANTGQTTIVNVPPNATYGVFYLTLVATAGTTPLTDFVLYHAVPEITAAAVVATTTAGDGTHNEVQTVTLTGGPTYGTWDYAWGGVSSNVTVSLTGLRYNEPASGVQAALNAALPYGSTYNGSHIVVTRAGTGTSGDPYVYTFTYSGASVLFTNVDAATVDGTKLGTYTTDTAIALGNNWDGITQIAGTTAGSVVVTVGPGVTGIADDDTGPNYFLNCVLPSKIAAKVLFDRTTGNEVYTYSLYADWS